MTAGAHAPGGARAGDDAEAGDARARDAGTRDAEAGDARARDAGARDAGARDAGARDAEAAGQANGPLVILTGPPGAGKSTVGRLLAGLLGVDFLDTDTVVEEAAGKPVADIFIQDGEAVFRDLERAAVGRCMAGHRGVLALGGGAVMDGRTQRLLSGQRVVYLETGFDAAAHRAGLDVPRPLLAGNPRARMRELLRERVVVYEALASITVRTDDREPQEIADEIAATVAAGIAAEAGEGAGASPAMDAAPGDGTAGEPAR